MNCAAAGIVGNSYHEALCEEQAEIHTDIKLVHVQLTCLRWLEFIFMICLH